jgi:hypothetical protein
MKHGTLSLLEGRAGLGSVASVIQSGLFVVIALSSLALGIERFVGDGLAGLATDTPALFLVLCSAFVLIAILGLAITPAEKLLLANHAPGLADFGAAMATLGHVGTIVFFSWWGFYALSDSNAIPPQMANQMAPIRWGVMFELVFVGGWVWIIAWVVARHGILPRGFLYLSVVKAICFWFTFAAFLANVAWMLVVGLGATALVVGPAWHLWIARLFPRDRPDADHG